MLSSLLILVYVLSANANAAKSDANSSHLFNNFFSLWNFSAFETKHGPELMTSREGFPRTHEHRIINCGTYDDDMQISSMVIKPDPILIPGDAFFTGKILFRKPIDKSVSAKLFLGYKLGFIWIPIPCIGNIGTCSYQNVCILWNTLFQANCSKDLVNAGLPCQCPISNGSITLNQERVFVGVKSWIPVGDYYLKMEMVRGGKRFGCYEVFFVFSRRV